MSFYGRSFIFDNIPSELYDLRILDFQETGGQYESPAGSDVTIFQKWIYRKPKTYHFGNSQNTPLEFDLTVGSFNPLIGVDRSRVSKWLLGRGSFLKLQICQDDIQDVYFNVICTSATNVYVGNVQRALKLHFVCDSPWGWTFPRTLSYTFTGDEIKNFVTDIYNDSDDNGYTYPSVEFTLNSIGNSFSIENYSDNNRIFAFTGISPNETVTVDNYLQIVESDTGLLRLSNFNKNWFRLVKGRNNVRIISGIGVVSIIYSFARKIGA